MNTHQANRYTQFITPLGGIIAFSCFFLPWLTRFNFGSSQSGFQLFVPNLLRPYAVFNAAVFIASVVIVGVSLYMVIRRTAWKSSVPVLISSGTGLAILFAEQMRYTRMTQIFGHSNYTIELGFWGTAAGLVIAIIGILLVGAEKESGDSKGSIEEERRWFVVHAGGIIALFCFFMPWAGFLSGVPGFELMTGKPIIFAFIASVIILIGSFYTLASGDFRRLRVVVLVSIGIGLGILFAYYADFYVTEIRVQNILRKSAPERLRRSMNFGFWGTILGYIIAAVGMFLTRRKHRDSQVEIPAESG